VPSECDAAHSHSPDNELPVAIIGFPIPEPNTILRNDNGFKLDA
jgi:hypothetical protein